MYFRYQFHLHYPLFVCCHCTISTAIKPTPKLTVTLISLNETKCYIYFIFTHNQYYFRLEKRISKISSSTTTLTRIATELFLDSEIIISLQRNNHIVQNPRMGYGHDTNHQKTNLAPRMTIPCD